MSRLPVDWHRHATEGDIVDAEIQISAARERLAAEPRPDVMYVADVPADGSVEIRWWSNVQGEWGRWHRVTGEGDGGSGQAYRYFRGVWAELHRDEVVQVRPVMDMQTGQTLGQVA